MKSACSLFLLLAITLTSSHAGELDDLLEGFKEDNKQPTLVVEPAVVKRSWIELSGDYTLSTAYNYQDRAYDEGIGRLRNTLNLTLDMKHSKKWKSKIEFKTLYDPIFEIDERVDYTRSLEWETELKEAYLQGGFGGLDLKLGRQITVWGKSETIRITDVINPLDSREPGMVDIKDLRLPVTTSRLSFSLGDWDVNLLAIHEARIQKEAELGSEFFPRSIFPAGFTLPEVVDPKSNKENTQYAASLDGRFSGWDLSFYAAKVLDQRWHIESGYRTYTPVRMSGMALNVVSGSWIIKTEAAFLQKLHYNFITQEKNRLDLLAGLEYSGIKDVTSSLEIANRHIYKYEDQMLNAPNYLRKDEMQTAFRTSYTFDHDNAVVSYLISANGQKFQDGGFQRIWIEYKLSDNVKFSSGFMDYISSKEALEKPYFAAISNNDKLFFDFKYSF